MEIIEALSITTRVADTITRVAMYEWNKKSITTLIISAAVLVCTAAVIHHIAHKKKRKMN